MRGIVKRDQPQCLTVLQAGPATSWGDVPGDCKAQMRAALIQEQGALCAYCEGRISDSPSKMKIEHWSARHDDALHGLIFTWSNLLGVCCGESGDEAHCDTYRGRLSTAQQALQLDPTQAPAPQSLLRMLGNGELVSDDPRMQADLKTLNLNCALLKRNRVAALDHARKRAGRFSRRELEQALKSLHVPNSKGELTEYLSVFERYYQRKLRAKS